MSETHTPVLDDLIKNGVLLERHYVAMNSPPSRSSLISGRLPPHLPDIQVDVNPQMVWNKSDNVSGFQGIPRGMTGLGTKLKQAGYATHYVGKWDAGWASPQQTPPGRGFDTFLGYMQAANSYWTKDRSSTPRVLDQCLNKFADFSFYNSTYRGSVTSALSAELGCDASLLEGKTFGPLGCNEDDPQDCLPESCYEDAMFLKRAVKVIQEHDETHPLFLTVASHFAHIPVSGLKSYMQKLDRLVAESGVRRLFPWTRKRKLLAAGILYLDDMVGKLVQALKERSLFENTLVVFVSENGGEQTLEQGGSNYPLRGGKQGEFEGGIRTNAFVAGGVVPPERRGTKFQGIFHIADWYATFCSLAGVDYVDHAAAEGNKYLSAQSLPLMSPVDSRPQWHHMMHGTNGRPDPLHISHLTVLHWPYKLITGRHKYGFWTEAVWPKCTDLGPGPNYGSVDVFGILVPLVNETQRDGVYEMVEDCGDGCLFNVEADPTEKSDLAKKPAYGKLLKQLQHMLRSLNMNNSKARIGSTQAVEACLKSAETGVLGPWVDVEDFYLGTQVRPEAKRDKEEILALHEALKNDPELLEKTALNIVAPGWNPHTICLNEDG